MPAITRHHFRMLLRPRRPSPALVVAAVALMLSGAGNAAAAVIISSNNQVAAHTIAGANAPSGDHQNLIPGSVGTTDLHNGAVTGVKVAAGSLTGTNLANGSIGTSKLKLPAISFSGLDNDPNDELPHHTVLSLDGVVVDVSCEFTGPPSTTILMLFVKSGASGTLDGLFSRAATNGAVTDTTDSHHPVGSTPVMFAWLESTSGTMQLQGQFTYYDSNRVITLTVTGSATFDHGCQLHGTALPAPS